MTKQLKPATTSKLVLHYNNDTSYTIPRVTNFSVSSGGKSVSGCYDKTVEFHGITQQHYIQFQIDLKDVTAFSYEGKSGEVSKSYQVANGRISSVTEWRGEDDYYKPTEMDISIGRIVQNALKYHSHV